MSWVTLPSKNELRQIAARQDAKQHELKIKRTCTQHDERETAAELIQRNYRGYRQRRELQGQSLSSSLRWADALKEAQYRASTRPRPRSNAGNKDSAAGDSSSLGNVRTTWRRAGAIARRAGNDDTSDTEGEQGMAAEEVEEHRKKKRDAKIEREKVAKTMGLEYFLEMVDQKHRYGSSLRAYHRVWQDSGSADNFFYWLDYGEGKDVDLEDRPRKRLDEEQIRYLSREERLKYLVRIDNEGLLCWAKNGQRITTSPDYKDSVDGIVPAHTKIPTWRETMQGRQNLDEESDNDTETDSESLSGISAGSGEDDTKYVNQQLHEAKGVKKLKYVSAGALMNNLLRKTTKKNTWIFVADTSFRLYIGIKQSGAFQHSSFLHGGRISSAGLIRIKRGQLRRLDPLSGHYAPPVKNFQGFVKNLEEAGADMSRVSISRSYAVLRGLESYLGAKRTIRKGEQKMKDMMRPEEAREREEREKDKTQSAQKERAILEAQAKEDESLKRQQSMPHRVLRKLHIGEEEPTGNSNGQNG